MDVDDETRNRCRVHLTIMSKRFTKKDLREINTIEDAVAGAAYRTTTIF